jgi:hypothetical protein
MRAAKLEIKLAIALFLSKFDYDLVDGSGKFPASLPQPDRNNIQNVRFGSGADSVLISV